ncbi:hypothetical protein [Rathayibacter sp. VKM Ac-2630]|uniref:hypothetical protein n=1 Tax=Rathayibacter sp. VKM Ac-2630 TaxID=1938617 RepID=UPI001115AB0E|nr:hypothetical protein [Rathayibacter sp. VKM Ac-2630]
MPQQDRGAEEPQDRDDREHFDVGAEHRHRCSGRDREERASVGLAPEEGGDLALGDVFRHQEDRGVVGVEDVPGAEQEEDAQDQAGHRERPEHEGVRPGTAAAGGDGG